MFKASHTIPVARDPLAVFDYVADAGRQRSWNALVRSMDRESAGPLGVGTRWRDVARVGRVNVKLIEYDRPGRVVHVARPWMAVALHVWEVHPVAGGCRLVQVRCGQRRWACSLRRSCVIVRRQLRDCARWLKQALEQDEAPPRMS